MGTKEFGDKFSALLGNISPIKGVEIKDPLLAKVAKLNETAMPHINVVYFRFQKPTGSEILQGDITKMMAGSITPERSSAPTSPTAWPNGSRPSRASDVNDGAAPRHDRVRVAGRSGSLSCWRRPRSS